MRRILPAAQPPGGVGRRQFSGTADGSNGSDDDTGPPAIQRCRAVCCTLGPRALTHGQREVRDVRTMFEASYRRLVAQMYGVCGDLTEAEDAVQEGFAKALAHESTFQRLDNPEAWLRTVSLNHLRSRWRRVRRHALLQHKLTEPALSVPDLSADHVALVAALRQLPTAQREVIALHHLGDLPVAEVARALGVPAGTVKARLSRGRAALAQLLDDPSSEAGTPHA